MARTSVTLKIPMSDFDVSSPSGLNKASNLWDTYLEDYTIASSSATEDYTTESWSIPLKLNLPKSCVVSSIKFPLQTVVTAPSTDGISFAIEVDGTQYSMDAYGNVADNNFVAHINNYRSQHGVFPNLTFVAGSWVLKPSSSLASSRAYWCMSNPIVVCTLEGGSSSIFRPTADVSVGHEIQSGFSHVYQLINETTADDDASYIGSFCEGSSAADPVDLTSVVATNISLPRKSNLVQLRVVTRSLLNARGINGGSAKANITLSFNDVEKTYSYLDASNDTANDDHVVGYDIYNTIEQVINADSPLIEAINSSKDTTVALKISLNTYAKGKSSDKGGQLESKARISQVYLEAVYEAEEYIDVHRKINGIWTQARFACQKQNGVWVKITEAECRNHLDSHLGVDPCVFRGHASYPLADVPPSCTSGGMTGGQICKVCGAHIKDHDTPIPPIEHDYDVNGICKYGCGTIYSNRISFSLSFSCLNAPIVLFAMPNATWRQWVEGNGTINAGSTSYKLSIDATGAVCVFDANLSQTYHVSTQDTNVLESDVIANGKTYDVYTHTWLEYIESDGSQWVNTGIVPQKNTRIVAEVSAWTPDEVSTTLFGTAASDGSARYDVFINSSGRYRSYYNNEYKNLSSSATVDGKTIIERNGVTVKIGDYTATNTEPTTFSSPVNPLYLFGHNDGNDPPSRRASLRLHSCQIYTNGTTLTRDLVPCEDPTGYVGLYDLVNNKMYDDAAGGTFVGGDYIYNA